ncbi:MAG: hypothetical protein PHU93_02830, partial [Candidatus Gracilibacteria bacterium]|nr:hypothetical protein [Candidatus Gracilibacteria bacterium]
LAIPSIITSTGSSLTPKIEITNSNSLSGTLLFHGRTLKNASAFNPNLTPVFSGSGKVLTTSTEITSLMTSLKNTYTSSGAPDVKSNTSIASLLTMNTGSLSELGVNLVKNELGISGVSGGPENTDTTVSGTCTSLPSNAVYYGGVTMYSLVNASAGTSLSASRVTTPAVNTCQFECGSGYIWDSNMNTCLLKITQPETGKIGVAIAILETWYGRNTTNQEIIDFCVSKGYKYPQGNSGNSWSTANEVTYSNCNNPGNCYGNTIYTSDTTNNLGGPIYWPMVYGSISASSNFDACMAVIPLGDNKFRNGWKTSRCGGNYYYQGTGNSINYSSGKTQGSLIWQSGDYILCTKP